MQANRKKESGNEDYFGNKKTKQEDTRKQGTQTRNNVVKTIYESIIITRKGKGILN